MPDVLVVFNATGQQGGSVVRAVLEDADLRRRYNVRGTTRDPSKPESQALAAQGVEVVQADIDNPTSLRKALAGAHTVFANTVTVYDGHAYEHEVSHGRALADAAVAAGVSHYIYSTLPNAGKISGGKLKSMGHFDGKAEVEEYVRTLPLKSAFVAPGTFMSNFGESLSPRKAPDGSYVLANFVSPETKMPLVDTAADLGKWVAAVLADFDQFEGQVLCGATDTYSFQDIVAAMSKTSGKNIAYRQLPQETWAGFLPELMRDHLVDMFRHFEDNGYYGKDTQAQVERSAREARGHLTTLDEYLTRHPLQLA